MDLPEKVYAIGVAHDAPTHGTPIIAGAGEAGFAPLSVVDGDGERALPVFTTQDKAEWGIRLFTTEEERTRTPVTAVLVDLEDLLRTVRETSSGAPKVHYVGVNMGEGGNYPMIRP